MYTLHGFALSGNTYKVAFALQLLQVPWRAQYVDYLAGQTRSADWRGTTNEMGEVPVLDDGTRLRTQSGAILSWLAARHGALGGLDDDERYEVLRWLLFDNHKFTSYFASHRFAHSFAPVAPDPAVMGWLRGRIDGAFGIVERHLQGREYLVGAAPTIADLSLSGYLFYPVEESGYDWVAQFPAIASWVARLRALPGWVDPYELLPGGRVPRRG